jgi:nucleotidyltransferase/DNA polymerase involved in DNA repair
MGVASDPFVAAYAAGVARTGSIKTIAPWEVRARLDPERIENICQLAPELATTLRQAGIRTGAQIAEQPLAVIKRMFGDTGVALWRACRGETNAAAFEVDNHYDAIRCRGILPPRTSSRRSVNSHLNRVCNRLLSVLRQRQRLSGSIALAMREQKQPAIEGISLAAGDAELQLQGLLQVVRKAFFQIWKGGSIQYIELSARQLYCPGGQLDLFDRE